MEINNVKITAGLLLDDRYKLLNPLSSEGGTADVWLALDTYTIDEVYDETTDQISNSEDSGIKVAIKIYRPKNALDLGEQRFRDEFKIVFNCHHLNLIQPINFSIYKDIPYLVLPYCHNGSSEQLQGKILDKKELWRYISDVSAGLEYLHDFTPTIVHHDIKPANVLIDDKGNYAITDFGISSHRGYNREGYDESKSGTMAYMAPERFHDEYESTPESDIWSFGATLYEIITGKVPFGEYGGRTQEEEGLSIPEITKPIPKDIKQLVYDCLASNPSKRPSASEIYKAAVSGRYPAKSKRIIIILIISILIIIGGLILLLLPSSPKDEPQPPVVKSNQELFEDAMVLVNSKDKGNVELGLRKLDSIRGFVPALYQQAYTFGWYADSASLSRKKILDIEVIQKGGNALLPKDEKISLKAIGFFTQIAELGDSAYPYYNADALYRLVLYNIGTEDVLKVDLPQAYKSLKMAQKWAEQANDTALLRKITTTLKSVQGQLDNK